MSVSVVATAKDVADTGDCRMDFTRVRVLSDCSTTVPDDEIAWNRATSTESDLQPHIPQVPVADCKEAPDGSALVMPLVLVALAMVITWLYLPWFISSVLWIFGTLNCMAWLLMPDHASPLLLTSLILPGLMALCFAIFVNCEMPAIS
eukprot:TRINITY_DN39512_c0_g1_i1.p1 TRINITY_DN39512_c0_g1~~TRINITY_DN39512_c0_g1_i1.p1  ORF type:complete len:148 (+),score=21.49 TRINITY_DN39512_c0_g1_i1:57-500(+)